jgi:hypothetical protein
MIISKVINVWLVNDNFDGSTPTRKYSMNFLNFQFKFYHSIVKFELKFSLSRIMKVFKIFILFAIFIVVSKSHEFDDLVEQETKKNNGRQLSRVVESGNCKICKNIIQNAKVFLEQRSIKVS